MTRSEISGYVQTVIGAIGIIVTILASPAMLDAFGQIGSSNGLPSEFGGISGAVRIFAVLFVLFCFVLLLMIGLSLVLSTVFRALGSGYPFLTGLFAIATVMCLAVTVTLAVLDVNFWITGFIAVFTLVWMTFASTQEPDEEGEALGTVAVIAIVGSILFLISGAITVIGNASAIDSELEPTKHALEQNSPNPHRDDRQHL